MIDLLERISRREEAAMAELYDRTCRDVFGLCRRLLGDVGSAEEAVLDAYLQVWNQAHAFDPARGAPEAWILTIARSRALDRRRQRQASGARAVAAEPAAGGERPDAAMLAGERRRQVRAALERLGPEEREVLGFAFFNGMTHREIAERIRVPLGTVKSRLRAGLIKLRQILQPMSAGSGS